MSSLQSPILFSDYIFLGKLKKFPTARLCELAILKQICAAGKEMDYDENEHKQIWNDIERFFSAKGISGSIIDFLWEFITQFRPNEATKQPTMANHISHYVHSALNVTKILGREANIVELGANHGILSRALSIMNNSVLCTDIHHGMLGNSIDSYKIGTWIRENFIGIPSVDSFSYPDNMHTLASCFENGLDAIVMRGTGILCREREREREST